MDASWIAGHKPRETAGSAAYRAFDFQIHFSMSKLLALHIMGEEFTAFFDHLDDLVLITGTALTSETSFYQVKSKIGAAWTTKQLANRPKTGDLPRSIIGKAYYNINQFGTKIRRSAIVSNQPLSAKYEDGNKVKADDGEITFSELCKEDLDVVATALAADFPSGVEVAHAKILTYERTPLDPQSFRKTLLGEVAEFTDKIDPGGSAAAKPVYNALLSEISRCTGDTRLPKTFDELKARKSLGRADVDALVERVQQRPRTVLEWWDVVATELSGTGVGAIKQQRLRLRCLSYWRERQRGSLDAVMFSEALSRHIDENSDLIGHSIQVSTTLLALSCEAAAPKGVAYDLEAALTVEIMERLP